MLDRKQVYSRVYGRSDGAMYFQNGVFYRPDGTEVGEKVAIPEPVLPEVPVVPESVEEPQPVAETVKPEPEEAPPTPFDPTEFFVTPPKNIIPQYELNYSREDLCRIGEKEGISGLRRIASPLGVKGRGKDELVSEILIAQDKAKLARKKFEEDYGADDE